jgi:hypothetical protein
MDVTWCQQHHLGGFRCVWKEKFGGAGISNGERIWIHVTGSSLCHWALVCKLSFCPLSRKAERLQEAHTCARWEKRHVHCEFGGWHKYSKRPPIGSRVVPLIQNDFWSKVVWSATHSPRHCITKMSIYQQDSQATSKLLEALGTSFRKQRSVMQIYLWRGVSRVGMHRRAKHSSPFRINQERFGLYVSKNVFLGVKGFQKQNLQLKYQR